MPGLEEVIPQWIRARPGNTPAGSKGNGGNQLSTTTTNLVASSRSKLFLLSVIALATGGMVFGIRTDILANLQQVFFEPIDVKHAAELIGAAVGAAFLGLAIANFVGGPMCDWVGMNRLLAIASGLHIAGALVIIFTPQSMALATVYWTLWLGMLSVGLAHGLIEAVINPLTATLYPEDKTHRLNVLHAWWPGGIIIGGLVAYGLGKLGVGWQIKQAIIILPALVYGILALATKFPPTERVAAGVSDKDMFREVLKPLFIVWFLCMFLTATTELTTGGWVDAFLTRSVGFKGILLLVYVSGLMFVMRHFAGGLAHKLSPVGLMWGSSLFAGIGLLALSWANSPVSGLVAATIWGIGICYMWPTMLAVASERFPRGGAFLMGLLGTAGNLSIFISMKYVGRIFDWYKVHIANGAPFNTKFENLSGGKLNEVLSMASSYSFRWIAVLPAVLLVVFGIIWLRDRALGGYKAEKLTAEPEAKAEKTMV